MTSQIYEIALRVDVLIYLFPPLHDGCSIFSERFLRRQRQLHEIRCHEENTVCQTSIDFIEKYNRLQTVV